MADLKEKQVSEKSIDVREHGNTLTFDDIVLKKIAGLAASEIPGILALSGNFITGITDKIRSSDDPTKGISVEVGKKQVAIDMKVICEYGRNIPEIFQSIVDRVGQVTKAMTGLEVVELNVHVDDVLRKDEFDKHSKKIKESEPNRVE